MNPVFEKYKDKHTGDRVFLIANGPSLKYTNLNLIKDEISIAMNKVSLIWAENEEWRPTYYLFSSTNVRSPIWGQSWINSVREAAQEERTTSFIAKQFKQWIDPQDTIPQINWFKSLSENKPDMSGNILESCFSRNINERIDKSGTSMNLALQLAYHMNFKEIVILGSDLGFVPDDGSTSDPNHFDESYRAEIAGYKIKKINNQMRNVHSLAYKNFLERNKNNPYKETKIYNASLKTYLDVYPVIDYENYILHNKIIYQQDKLKKAKEYWDSPHQYVVE